MKLKVYSYQTGNLLFSCDQTELLNRVEDMGLGNYKPCQILPNPKFPSVHYVIDKQGGVLATLKIYQIIYNYVIKHKFDNSYLRNDNDKGSLMFVNNVDNLSVLKYTSHSRAVQLLNFLRFDLNFDVTLHTVNDEVEYIHE